MIFFQVFPGLSPSPRLSRPGSPGRQRRLQPAAGAHPHRPSAPDPRAPGVRGASTGGRWEIRQRALRAGRPLKKGGNGGNPQGTGWGHGELSDSYSDFFVCFFLTFFICDEITITADS